MNQLIENKKDSSTFWKSVKLVLPDKNSSNINVIWDPRSKELVAGSVAVNLINDYFSEIGETVVIGIGAF